MVGLELGRPRLQHFLKERLSKVVLTLMLVSIPKLFLLSSVPGWSRPAWLSAFAALP